MPSAVDGDGATENSALTAPMLRRIVRYSVLPYVRELLTERGRDTQTALEKVEAFFASHWSAAGDEEDDAE
jgi:hypothetical protein